MADNILYKPHELFVSRLEKQFHQGAENYFDELVKKANVDKGGNAVHVKAYKAAAENVANASKALKKSKGWLTFIRVLYFFVIGLFLIPVAIKLKNKIKDQQATLAKLEADAKEKLDTCYADLAALNSLYDWNMPVEVMEKSTPIIDLDPTFTPERLCYLKEKFGLDECPDESESVVGVLSGHINGNPFILEKVLNEDTRPKVYEGSIVITWTTTSRDSNGNMRTVTHTQTLTAQVTHPAPFYDYETRVIYGNEAAPHLTFSRSPSGADKMDEKKRRKEAEKGAKELRKMAEKSLTKNPTGHVFTPMGNDAFDVFFGGTDRNNEVEYRLLFTPLAQQNELDIITNPEPFGDDFYMVKDKMITSVASRHSQSFDYSADPEKFVHYDVEEAKKVFVTYCDAFIKNLYFDLAPIISIPLYQMHKPHEYIYKDVYPTNLTSFEHEVMANKLDKAFFIPDDADSSLPLILKSRGGKKGKDGTDNVTINAYSFHTTPRVDYVNKMGGDGKMHTIPVPWVQYDKVDKDSVMTAKFVGGNNTGYKSSGVGGYYQRGIAAFTGNADAKTLEKLNNLFKQ